MKRALFFVAAALALVACQKEEKTPVTEPAALVKIEPVITRATSTNFETGDKIGVTIVKGEAEHASNACLTYSEADQTFSGDLKWYEQGGEACTVKAFYPYQEAGFPTTFTVAADQTKGAGASDFMVAAKSNVYPQRNAVAMQFRHYMSQIVVNIDNKADAEVESVVFKNLVCKAGIGVEGDIITVTPADGAGVGDIMAETVTANKKYRIVMVPQTSVLKMVVKVKDGAVLVTDIPESTIKQGYSYNISAEISADNVKVALAGEILNWDNGGDLTGTQTAEVSFHEYLDAAEPYFEYDNVNYKVVKLKDGNWWMAQNLAFIPEGYEPCNDLNNVAAGVYYPVYDDGTAVQFATDAATIAANGYLYQSEVALGLKVNELTSEDQAKALEGAQGICPKGWHLPTSVELNNLVGKMVSPIDTKTDAPYYNGSNGSISLLNADGFNVDAFGAVAVNDNTRTNASLMGHNGSYPGRLTSGYFCGSSFAGITYITSGNPESGVKNMQFWGMMPMTNKAAEADYTCNGSKLSYKIGASVRCVRDTAE